MKTYNYIYLIRNLINGKIYVGKHSTNDLNDGYMGSGIAINKAYKKYGKENFNKELLCMCGDENELNEMEIYYIAKFNSTDRTIGYNLTFGGDGVIPNEETRKKISEAQKGRTLSDETKKKMSESRKGEKNPNFGKHFSDEYKEKLSESHKGKKQSPETIQKRSESMKGRTLSDETKKKISEANKGENNPVYGKHWSLTEETKRKQSESKKGKQQKKFKWLTPTGEIIEMSINNVKRWHPDWILIEE